MISVGIDVSKDKSTVSIVRESGTILTPTFNVTHTREEVFMLIKKIKAYPDEVRVVIEYTGHYHLPLVTELVKNDIFVCCVNALRMKKYCSQSLRRAKTDKIDSFKIASYGITYWFELLPVCSKSDTYEELRILSRQADLMSWG